MADEPAIVRIREVELPSNGAGGTRREFALMWLKRFLNGGTSRTSDGSAG